MRSHPKKGHLLKPDTAPQGDSSYVKRGADLNVEKCLGGVADHQHHHHAGQQPRHGAVPPEHGALVETANSDVHGIKLIISLFLLSCDN